MDSAPAIVRVAHHRGVEADRDVVQKYLVVDRPDIDPSLGTVLKRGQLARRISDVCPAVFGEVVSGAAGNHDQGDVVFDCYSRDGTHRSVSSCGDQHLSSRMHHVPRQGFCPVTGAQLTDIDLPCLSGPADGGLVPARA
jgi:hypothetical protein